MSDNMTVSEAQAIWWRHGLTGLPSFDVALVLRRLGAVTDAARRACEVWATLETPRALDEAMTALVEALLVLDAKEG